MRRATSNPRPRQRWHAPCSLRSHGVRADREGIQPRGDVVSGAVVWFTGAPASGKSSLAARLAAQLRDERREPLVLDGDEVRASLVPTPGYDDDARDAFYLTLGNLACLGARQGLIAIIAATGHRRRWRDRVREAAPHFVEVHVATPVDECRRRDPKGLYHGAESALPGAGVPYEPPLHAEVTAPAGDDPLVIDAVLARLGISSF